jgi:hypothetical protein
MQQQVFRSPVQLSFLWFTQRNDRPVVVHGTTHQQVMPPRSSLTDLPDLSIGQDVVRIKKRRG